MTTDTLTRLEQPITGGGIRSVNFFNGRLLTGEDLSREQDANKLARLRLGRAIGSGVAYGLEVEPALGTTTNERPIVTVEAGLAVNRDGEVLELPATTDVALTRERPAAEGGPEVVFSDCTPLQPGTYSAGAGVYLLTIGPAAAREGRAPVSGLGNEEAACNTAFSVEGVRFRLIRLALPTGYLGAPDLLRNRVAHLLFGTVDARRLAFAAQPLGAAEEKYGLLDDLLGTNCLDESQVPLAVLSWTAAAGLRFVDLWSARRRLTEAAADRRWPPLTGDRRRSEAEAVFLQFQDQVEEMRARLPGLSTIAASTHFQFVPPVGVLPVGGTGSPVGFDPAQFFGAQASADVAMLDAPLLRALVHESFSHEPIQIGSSEKVQLYLVWENDRAVVSGQTSQRVLVFAKHTLPYCGVARFGHARWSLSRFAPSVI